MYLRCGENLAVLIKKTRKTNCNDLIAVESGFRLAPPSKDWKDWWALSIAEGHRKEKFV